MWKCESVSHSVVSDSVTPWTVAPPGSSVQGILQARILEWIAIPFSRESSQPKDRTQVSCIPGKFFYRLSHQWSPYAGEGNGTPLQHSCLENRKYGGAWWAAVHGVAKTRTRLSDFTFTFHFHALEKEMATNSSVIAWRIPGTGGAWWAAIYGVAQSRTRLKQLSSSSSKHLKINIRLPFLVIIEVTSLFIMFFQRSTFLSSRREEIFPISLLLRVSGWTQIAGFPGKTLLQDYETTEVPLRPSNVTVHAAAEGFPVPGHLCVKGTSWVHALPISK